MRALMYLNHIGRAQSEFRCYDIAIHQDSALAQTSRVFSACDDVQESVKGCIIKRMHLHMTGNLELVHGITFDWYLNLNECVSYDVLPLPVAPMIAFMPGLIMPLQQKRHF